MKFPRIKIAIFAKKQKWQIGASLVEYGLLVALIAVVALPSVKRVGREVACKNALASALLTARPTTPGIVFACLGTCCWTWQENFLATFPCSSTGLPIYIDTMHCY